jgi:hypothetical protein
MKLQGEIINWHKKFWPRNMFIQGMNEIILFTYVRTAQE